MKLVVNGLAGRRVLYKDLVTLNGANVPEFSPENDVGGE